MKVVTVGGGIAGFGLANHLAGQDVDVIVLEKADAWTRLGYGISLWENGIRLVQEMGLAGPLWKKGQAIHEWVLCDDDGEELTRVRLDSGKNADENKSPLLAIHRADLHEILRNNVPDVDVRMGVTVDAIAQNAEDVHIILSDGHRETCDLLVGADGIGSRVRTLAFSDWSLEDTQTAVWSFWAPDALDLPDGFTEVWGEGGKALLIAPIAGRHMVSFAAPVAAETAALDETAHDPLLGLRQQVGAQDWMLPDIVAALDATQEIFHDRLYQVEASTWVNGRLVLIGDAAHALHPIVGMGASLALEDAAALAQEMVHPHGDWLQRYVARRQPRVAEARRQANWSRMITFTQSELLAFLRNRLVRHTPLLDFFVCRQTA